ncbi:hypothetical protein [Raineyella antarctica]|uniref:hypothetical protein n=1 Tax=Raineyella antarctica TaxID=1577474 RepID=UPI000B84EF96|nr:hypothetical protein [Raineyella antarctica]
MFLTLPHVFRDSSIQPEGAYVPARLTFPREWTSVIREFENGSRMVTFAKWRDGAIVEAYIWA